MGNELAVVKKSNRHPAVVQLLEEFAPGKWLRPEEVAEIFRVDPKTVIRWIKAGVFKVTENGVERDVKTFKTPGKHTRFFAPDIKQLLDANEDRP